jgi:hypothetical protein
LSARRRIVQQQQQQQGMEEVKRKEMQMKLNSAERVAFARWRSIFI